jgi:hypothetical protein
MKNALLSVVAELRRALSLGIGSFRITVGAIMLVFASTGASAAPSKKPIVAVFDVQDLRDGRARLSAKVLRDLTTYLATRLAEGGVFKVVPDAAIRAALAQAKADSYAACYDDTCQIEIGKALAAQTTLSTKLISVDNQCMVVSSLYDLKEEATENTATRPIRCQEESLTAAFDDVVRKLEANARGGTVVTSVERKAEGQGQGTLEEEAVQVIVRERCLTGAKAEGDGRFTCAGNKEQRTLQIQARAGAFLGSGRRQVLLAVRDNGLGHAEGAGYALLMERSGAGWTTLLQEKGSLGFLLLLGAIRMKDGRDHAVLCRKDCWQGCCIGFCGLTGVVEAQSRITLDTKEFTSVFRREGQASEGQGPTWDRTPMHNIEPVSVEVRDLNGDGIADVVLDMAEEEGTRRNKERRIHRLQFESDGRSLHLKGTLPYQLPQDDGC